MIDEILENQNYTEYIFNAWNQVYVEEEGRLKKIEGLFENKEQYLRFVHELSSDLDKDMGLKEPFVKGLWQGFRVQMISFHINQSSPTVNLRRINESKWRLDTLKELQSMDAVEKEYIQEAIQEKKNILVVGPTGSGKTSLLSACINEIDDNERAVILEDTSELKSPNAASTKLITYEREEDLITSVSLQDLVKVSLRLRPDRIVIGEIRSEEAKNLILALSTGHSGCMATLHARDANEALARLEILVQLGAPSWRIETIRRLIFYSFDLVLTIHKCQDGKRRLVGIDKLSSVEENAILVDPVVLNFFSQHKKVGW